MECEIEMLYTECGVCGSWAREGGKGRDERRLDSDANFLFVRDLDFGVRMDPSVTACFVPVVHV